MSNFEQVKAMHAKFELANTEGPTALTVEEYRFRVKAMVEELVEYMQVVFKDRIKRGDEFLGLDDMKALIWAHVDKLELRDDVNRPEVLEEQFDALIDLSVFTYGTGDRQGFPFDVGFKRVMDKNMQKELAGTGENSKRGFARDLVKPKGWTAPVLIDLVVPVKKGK